MELFEPAAGSGGANRLMFVARVTVTNMGKPKGEFFCADPDVSHCSVRLYSDDSGGTAGGHAAVLPQPAPVYMGNPYE